MTNDSHAKQHEPMDGQEQMPLTWPLLTDAERAELSDSAPNSVLMPAFLASVP
jgi:hypothetical protein